MFVSVFPAPTQIPFMRSFMGLAVASLQQGSKLFALLLPSFRQRRLQPEVLVLALHQQRNIPLLLCLDVQWVHLHWLLFLPWEVCIHSSNEQGKAAKKPQTSRVHNHDRVIFASATIKVG